MGKVELKLEVDADLLARSKAAGLDVSDIAEKAMRSALEAQSYAGGVAEDVAARAGELSTPQARAERWAQENAEAIEAYNARIARRGIFGTDLRRW
jgi:antitoxin CcdA